jgi:hypothetical protein
VAELGLAALGTDVTRTLGIAPVELHGRTVRADRSVSAMSGRTATVTRIRGSAHIN